MRKEKGFTLIELLVVVVILGIISLIASGMLLNALDKSREAAVKANISAAASTLTSDMVTNSHTAEESITENIEILNNPDGEADTGDEIISPFRSTLDAFLEGSTGGPGQVALEAITTNDITIRGFGKQGSEEDPIAVKTISGIEEAEDE